MRSSFAHSVDNRHNMLPDLLLTSAAVASISWTLTETEVFREVRDWLKWKCKERPTLFRRKLAYLVTCSYCASHWVGAGFYVWRSDRSLVGYFALMFLTTTMLTLFHLLRVFLRGARGWADKQEASR